MRIANNDLGQMLRKAQRFLERNVQWVTRTAILFIVGIILAHAFFAESVKLFTGWLGFAEPSLASLLALSVLIFVVERVVVIEQALSEVDKERPLRVFPTNEAAYEHLALSVGELRPRRVDLLQFSGWHSLVLVRRLSQLTPKPTVRMLLMDPGIADRFDTHEFHSNRIVATEASARRAESDENVTIEVRYYRSVPSLSVVLMDDALVNLSWYCCHEEPDTSIFRLLGHSCAAVQGRGSEAAPLVAFARGHFDQVWSTARGRPPHGHADQEFVPA
jgi:hypothetical protein